MGSAVSFAAPAERPALEPRPKRGRRAARSRAAFSSMADARTTQRLQCYVVRQVLQWLEMSRTVSQRELRNDAATVLGAVQRGETVIVTRNGTPIAELRPLPPRRFVPRSVLAEAAKSAPRIDARRFRADVDAVIDQSVDG